MNEAGRSAGRFRELPLSHRTVEAPRLSEVLSLELEVMAAKPQGTKAVLREHSSQ